MIHISCIGLPPGPDKKMTKNEQKLLKEKIFRAVDRTKKDRKKNRTMVKLWGEETENKHNHAE